MPAAFSGLILAYRPDYRLEMSIFPCIAPCVRSVFDQARNIRNFCFTVQRFRDSEQTANL